MDPHPFHPADLNGLDTSAPDLLGHSRAATVLLAGKLNAFEAPGGGEVQMACLARALPGVGVCARLWRPWEDDLARAEWLHLFGSLPEHLPLVEMAKRRGLRVALSPITWFSLQHYWLEPRSLPGRAAACARFAIRAAFPQLPSWRMRLYHQADLLMPNSQAEAEQLMRLFGVPANRIRVVPNGASLRFAEATPDAFVRETGLKDFVLYPGRIEPRKNQLNFLRAMRGSGARVVILGDPAPGCEAYFAECRRATDDNVRFLARLDHDDPLLASAYAACRCLALASWYETPGLVALEAGMLGKPLVLPEDGCAKEYFGDFAEYVEPTNLAGIRRATLAAMDRPPSAELAQHVQENFSWQTAARITSEAYEEMGSLE